MIVHSDFREAISNISDNTVQLVWTDPPFGTGERQYLKSTKGTNYSYKDALPGSGIGDVVEMASLMADKMLSTGVMAICLDYRIVHEVKTAIDTLGYYDFRGEIIYHFELGAISRNWWTNKHNTILLYSMNGGVPKFNQDAVPRVPRQSKRGTYQTDDRKVNSVWSITMGPSDSQRTGYPNQKPLQLVEPFVLVHTDVDDLVVDPFAGSGTTGYAAMRNGRQFVCIDSNKEAVDLMRARGLEGF